MANTAKAIKVQSLLMQVDAFPEQGKTQASLLHELIAKRAYYHAEQRGFEPGHEQDDWLRAERELYNVLVFSNAGAL